MFRRYRSFFVILAIMTLVWFVMDMSERRTYQTSVSVVYVGIDTARYAIVQMDGTLPLTVESDGFTALLNHWLWRKKPLEIDLSHMLKHRPVRGETRLSAATADLAKQLQSHLSPVEGSLIAFGMDSLSVTISERKGKAYKPHLRGVTFSFNDGYGLSGSPMLAPDSVYLYGSERSLNAIEAIYTKAARVPVADSGGTYRLELDPVWREYPDLRVSQTSVTLYVPAEPYVEARYSLPVSFESGDSAMRVKLYPDNVIVTAWVPRGSSAATSQIAMKAVVRRDAASSQNGLPVSITNFPTDVQIKSVEPDRVQYVILK